MRANRPSRSDLLLELRASAIVRVRAQSEIEAVAVAVADALAFCAKQTFSASLERVRQAQHAAAGRIGYVRDDQ